jgi:HSP20 family protein
MSTLTKWNPFQTSRWEPFRELEEIERRLESLFERSPFSGFSPSGPLLRPQEGVAMQQWHPYVDISEDDKEYTVKADLPEVAKGDVKVSFREGVLEIAGERKQEKKEASRRFHRTERSYGAFLRSFTLPAAAEGEKAKAEFHEGVLTVRIPKSEKLAPKAIEVKVN